MEEAPGSQRENNTSQDRCDSGDSGGVVTVLLPLLYGKEAKDGKRIYDANCVGF